MSEPSVFVSATSVITPMGQGASAILDAIAKGQTGVKVQAFANSQLKTVCAALFDEQQQSDLLQPGYSFFESLLLRVMQSLPAVDCNDPRTLLVLASTKGNIGLLTKGAADPQELTALTVTGRKLAKAIGYPRQPVVVSTPAFRACRPCSMQSDSYNADSSTVRLCWLPIVFHRLLLRAFNRFRH